MNSEWPTSVQALRIEYDRAVSAHGKSHAISEMARKYGIPDKTARNRLTRVGITGSRKLVTPPAADDLRRAWDGAVSTHGKRGAIRALAGEYGVDYVTVRSWLTKAELWTVAPQTAKRRPITTACPCGAAATSRYRDQDPPLCFRCYMRTWSADPTAPSRRAARDYIDGVKAIAACADCHRKYPPCVYHFDHVPERGPKLFSLGLGDYAVETVKAEIAKCDIVCANCHAIRTWNRSHPSQQVACA